MEGALGTEDVGGPEAQEAGVVLGGLEAGHFALCCSFLILCGGFQWVAGGFDGD